jgi:vitamin B12 transporter
MGFRAGYFDTKGFSAADGREGNAEPDGSRSWNLGGTKDFPLNDRVLLRLDAQYQDNRTDTDSNGGRGGDSFNTYARHSQFLLREENVVLLPGDAELTVAGDYASHDREDSTNGGDYYKASLWKVEAVAKKPHLAAQDFTLGLEYSVEGGRSSQTTGGWRRLRDGAAYLQDQLKLGRFYAVAGARFDARAETENAGTYRVGLGYWIVPARLRAKGSLGTGFKAPSLYQTYSAYGSESLRPERSLGGDLGLELTGEDWSTDLTVFANRFRDLIDFNLVTNRYFNQSRAETYGVEWSAERRFGLFRAGNALTLLRAVDPDTGLLLLRRPRWSDTLDLGVSRARSYSVSLHARYVGTREDAHPLLFTRQPMPAFWTLGADFSGTLAPGLRLVGRGDNLLDRDYQETSGFGVPALSAYAGLEADL